MFWIYNKFCSFFIENKPQCITEMSQFPDLKMWKQCMHDWHSTLLILHFFFFFLGQKCVFHKLHSFFEFCWYCSFKWTARGKWKYFIVVGRPWLCARHPPKPLFYCSLQLDGKRKCNKRFLSLEKEWERGCSPNTITGKTVITDSTWGC